METTETKNPKTTSVRVPPFVLLTALIIASTSHAALVKWCQARKDYKQQQVGMMLQHNKEEVDGAITSINQPKKKARIISNAVSLKPSFKRQGKPDQPVKRESVTPPHGGCLKCTGPQWLVHGP
uniref:Uncharacterized protein n=1 Tax=Phytophthora fragariae TaxID=53985 RepID=A0A6A3FLQ6_9STRA|nr:hypothetical protein PF009_g3383 [Phytophthora fragariae]